MKETWKDIDGYQGYQVSNLGRVRTHNKVTHTAFHGERKWKDRILKPKVAKDKCARVDLWKDGSHKTMLVHRIVADAFLGKNPTMTVNHKDGNRLNNCVDNLEWMSIADNIRHGFRNGLYTSQHPCTLIDANGNKHIFRSLSQASRFLNHSDGYVSGSLKANRQIKDADGNVYEVSA